MASWRELFGSSVDDEPAYGFMGWCTTATVTYHSRTLMINGCSPSLAVHWKMLAKSACHSTGKTKAFILSSARPRKGECAPTPRLI